MRANRRVRTNGLLAHQHGRRNSATWFDALRCWAQNATVRLNCLTRFEHLTRETVDSKPLRLLVLRAWMENESGQESSACSTVIG